MVNENPSIFAIVGYDDFDKSYNNVGTGFVINDAGYFVTAAHTFKKKGRQFFALINGKGMLFKKIFCEYDDLGEQKAPIHRDLFIGHIENKVDLPFLTFEPSEELNPDDVLELSGYSSKIYKDQPLSIEDLYDDDNESIFPDEVSIVDNQKLPQEADAAKQIEGESKKKLKGLDKLKFSNITAKFKEQDFENLFEMVHVEGVFTNGYRFTLTNEDIEPSGLSGCPIICNEVVVGMLISAEGAISSDYIVTKLDENNIDYNIE